MKKIFLTIGMLILCHLSQNECLEHSLVQLEHAFNNLHLALKKPVAANFLGNYLVKKHKNTLRSYNQNQRWYQILMLQQQNVAACGFHAVRNSLYLLQALDRPFTDFMATYQKLHNQADFNAFAKKWNVDFALALGKDEPGAGMFLTDAQTLINNIMANKYNQSPINAYANQMTIVEIPARITREDDPALTKIKQYIEAQGIASAIQKKQLLQLINYLSALQRPIPQLIHICNYIKNVQALVPTHESFIIGSGAHIIAIIAHAQQGTTEYLIADSVNTAFVDPHDASKKSIFYEKWEDLVQLLGTDPDELAWYYIDYRISSRGDEKALIFEDTDSITIFTTLITQLKLTNTILYQEKYKTMLDQLIAQGIDIFTEENENIKRLQQALS